MNFTQSLQTIFEVILVSATIAALFNEKRLAAFEKGIIAKIRRRRLKVIRGNNMVKSTYIPATRKA